MDGEERFRRELVRNNFCPECLGELDTGWECNRCGYDARHLVDGLECETSDSSDSGE